MGDENNVSLSWMGIRYHHDWGFNKLFGDFFFLMI